jgi:hypothetical protein
MFDRAHYASCANNTKWSELREAMVAIYPRHPRFRVKGLNWTDEWPWDGEWYYHFRLDHHWKNMEWVELKPGSLEISISSDEIAEVCRRIGFETERHGDIVRIIGYRKLSQN